MLAMTFFIVIPFPNVILSFVFHETKESPKMKTKARQFQEEEVVVEALN